MNFHEFSEEVAQEEGLKKSIDIAQIKEVTRIIFSKLANMSREEINELLVHYVSNEPKGGENL